MKKLLTILLSVVMVMAMMPSMIFADGVDYSEDAIINISNSNELIDAIKNQQNGQTWNLAAGTYDIGDACRSMSETINGETEFVFPIFKNNLHIVGEKGVIITSSYVAETGNWHDQNFITVSGENVCIENLALKSNTNSFYNTEEYCFQNCNKVIEIVSGGKNFKLRNVELLPVNNEENKKCTSGCIYFNTDEVGDNVELENVTLSSWISVHPVTEGGTVSGNVKIKNVTQDFSNNCYEGEGASYAPGLVGSDENFEIEKFTIQVDGDINFVEQLFGDDLKSGTTIELKGDITETQEIKINKTVTIIGNDHTITVNHDVTGNNDSAGILVGADNVFIENVKVLGPNNTDAWKDGQYVIKAYNADNLTLKDVKLLDGSGAIQANGSSVNLEGNINLNNNVYNGVEVLNNGKVTMGADMSFIVPEDYKEAVIWKDTAEAGTIVTNGTIAQSFNPGENKENEHRYVAQTPTIVTEDEDRNIGYYLTANDAIIYLPTDKDVDVTLKADTTLTPELVGKLGKGTITAEPGVKVTNGTDTQIEINTPNGTVYIGANDTVESKPYEPPTTGGGGYYDPLATPKKDAVKAVEDSVVLTDYDAAEQAVIKDILAKAKKDIEAAKTKEEIEALTVAAKAELDKVLTTAEKEEAAAAEKTAKLIAGVQATTLKARSEADKGYIRVKWSKSYGYKMDYFEVYKAKSKTALKKSTKPYFKTKNGKWVSYKNTKGLKKGTKYFYRVRGVREINGQKYYTEFSTMAYRFAK